MAPRRPTVRIVYLVLTYGVHPYSQIGPACPAVCAPPAPPKAAGPIWGQKVGISLQPWARLSCLSVCLSILSSRSPNGYQRHDLQPFTASDNVHQPPGCCTKEEGEQTYPVIQFRLHQNSAFRTQCLISNSDHIGVGVVVVVMVVGSWGVVCLDGPM